MNSDNCRRCKLVLVTEDELDYGLCENCLELAIEDSIERRDWNYWHEEG